MKFKTICEFFVVPSMTVFYNTPFFSCKSPSGFLRTSLMQSISLKTDKRYVFPFFCTHRSVWPANIARGLWRSCKTLIAVGWLTRWKQTFPLVPCSYWYCDDRKSDRCQPYLPRQLVIPHRQTKYDCGGRDGGAETFIFVSFEKIKKKKSSLKYFFFSWEYQGEKKTYRGPGFRVAEWNDRRRYWSGCLTCSRNMNVIHRK